MKGSKCSITSDQINGPPGMLLGPAAGRPADEVHIMDEFKGLGFRLMAAGVGGQQVERGRDSRSTRVPSMLFAPSRPYAIGMPDSDELFGLR